MGPFKHLVVAIGVRVVGILSDGLVEYGGGVLEIVKVGKNANALDCGIGSLNDIGGRGVVQVVCHEFERGSNNFSPLRN